MRINFYGGPGSGKSTIAAWAFYELKIRNYSIEHVSEYVKSWVYYKRPVKFFDQLYLFAKQQQYEYRYLSNGVDHIVTDSPTFLAYFYAKHYGHDEITKPIYDLNKAYEHHYPCINIFLERGEKLFQESGRYQTKDEAKDIDKQMKKDLIDFYGEDSVLFILYLEKEKILDYIYEKINKR